MRCMLRQAKLGALRVAEETGLSRLIASCSRRRRRLLILSYHGVSTCDEHEWNGGLYISAKLFRRRMELLARTDCSLLPLSVALERLFNGTLPPRAVAITFVDGLRDFYTVAFPIVKSF